MDVGVPVDGSFCTHHPEELDVFNAIFAALCLITFCRLDVLGFEAVGQRLDPDRVVIECRIVEGDPWGVSVVLRAYRGTRWSASSRMRRSDTVLLVRVRRYRCEHCGRTWRQGTTAAAAPWVKISRVGLGWVLAVIVVDHLTVFLGLLQG